MNTFIIVILAVALVLALVAGVVETCIASYNIRRARRAEAKVRDAESRAERCSELLERVNTEEQKKQDSMKEKFIKVIESLIKPNRANIIKAVKKATASGKFEKIADLTEILIYIKNDQNAGTDNSVYMTELCNEVCSIQEGNAEE